MATVPTGRNLRAAITEVQLSELYTTKRLTIEDVAAKFGVAPTMIARRFKDLGIRARQRGPLPRRQRGDFFEGGLEWTADLAYLVGLITTDGWLSPDGRHLTITSKDVDLLQTARRCLGVTARIALTTNPRPCYRLQWSDTMLYRWLIDIGLMPAKSLHARICIPRVGQPAIRRMAPRFRPTPEQALRRCRRAEISETP